MSPGKVNAANFAKMMRSLQLGGLTCVELAKASGLHRNTIRDYTNALKDAEVLYIEDWKQTGGNNAFLPVYRVGTEEDAAKPQPLTRSQIQARYAARNKQPHALDHRRITRDNIEVAQAVPVRRIKEKQYKPMTRWVEVPRHAKT